MHLSQQVSPPMKIQTLTFENQHFKTIQQQKKLFLFAHYLSLNQ